jgi:hydroxymethylbilane synthase
MHRLRIATRKSKLALWQAQHAADLMRRVRPGLQVELVPLSTQGDQFLDAPLSKIGGKGLFIKELERALLDGDADIAVHSMKDVPAELPEGLVLPAVLPRPDPRAALVSNRHGSLTSLPAGSIVGSSSLRRQCMIRHNFPELELRFLRGNVQTRLARLDDGEYDAIVLAAAGLKRLGLDERIREAIAPELCLPAVGQGSIGIECRADDDEVQAVLAEVNDPPTWIRTQAERAFNFRMEGSCAVPLAAYAELDGNRLRVRGMVGDPEGRRVLTGERQGEAAEAASLGDELARELLERGGREILDELFARG